jgi:hypothetical protein
LVRVALNLRIHIGAAVNDSEGCDVDWREHVALWMSLPQ